MDEKVAKLCVAPECSILDAIKVLDETHERILLVVEKQRLLGIHRQRRQKMDFKDPRSDRKNYRSDDKKASLRKGR